MMVIHSWSGNGSGSVFPPGAGGSAGDPPAPPGSPGLSRTGHSVVAVCLGFILFFGCFNNLLVLLVFARFRSLWTPINVVLLNISASDMLVCLFGTPFSFASSLYGRWLLGQSGCEWYGFANSLFGIVSLVSLSVLSYERYMAVLRATKPDTSDFRKAWRCVAGAWLYSLVWTLPPFLGWSSYGPEGPGTTCSVQWHQRSPSSVSYVVCLFIFCLVLPLLLMVYCYGKILFIIKGVTKINLLSAQRRENHILLMVLTMVSCYLLCWMPYGVVSLMATFGKQGLITPVASVVPSVLAKSSTVINPVIYVLFNNQQVEFNMCMASRLDRLTPEQRENCLKLVGNSWGTGQDGKVAFLSGRGFYTLPAARLVLTKKTPGIKVKDQLNTLYWDQNHSMTKKINLNSDGSFTVEQPGYYYIYSQVSFSKGHPKVPLRQTLWTRKPDKDKKQEADWKELLMSYCSLPQSSPVSNVCTASQAGVFELQKNQQLRVNVTSSDLVNEESTTLGLFKLQD